MKLKIVSTVFFLLAFALLTWNISATVEELDSLSATLPATEAETVDVELSPSLLTAELEPASSGSICQEKAVDWDAQIESLDKILGEPLQQAFTCPSYFYQLSCNACGPATTQCINEGNPLWLCTTCAEVCRCNAIDCICY